MIERQIYYAGSITAATANFKNRAARSIEKLRKHGKVLTEHLARSDCIEFEAENKRKGVNIFERDIAWLNNSDAMVFDATEPTTGGGMELMYNSSVLYHPTLVVHDVATRVSNMVTQFKHPMIEIQSYGSFDQLDNVFDDYFDRHPLTYRAFPKFGQTCAIDGAGKGAIYEAVKEWCRDNNMEFFNPIGWWAENNSIPTWQDLKKGFDNLQCILVAEPTYAWAGKLTRDVIIAKDNPRPYSALATAHSYSLDRDVLYKRLVIDALEDGAWVFSDRGVITSLVYQPVQAEMFDGYSREFFKGSVLGLPGNQQSLQHAPGLLILPQVDADLAMDRLESRNDKSDNARFEVRPFQREIAKVYASAELREFYERKGTKVEYLTQGATREETKAKARQIWETYSSGV